MSSFTGEVRWKCCFSFN